MHSRSTFASALGCCLALALAAAAAASQAGTAPAPRAAATSAPSAPADAEMLTHEVARELVRLDERLGLGTFPDASPLWPSRLAASIERRLAPGAEAVPGSELLRRLAEDLRALGGDQPLGGPPELRPAPDASPGGWRRADKLERLLETSRLLNRTLDRAERTGCGRSTGASARGVAPRTEPLDGSCAAATSTGTGTSAGSTLVTASGGLAGTVIRQGTGAPLPGVTVKVYSQYGYYVTETQSGTDGTYQADGLAVGTYYAEAVSDGFLDEIYDGVVCAGYFLYCEPYYEGTQITVGAGVTGSVDFALVPGASISGTLTEEGTGDPLSGYAVLYADSGSELTSVSTGADGSYALTGLPPGKYYVVAQASNHRTEVYDDVACTGGCDLAAGTRLDLTSGAALTGIDFAMTRLGAISGTVTNESTAGPISGLELRAFDSEGAFAESVFSTSDGTYEIPGLSAGTYFVRTYGTSSTSDYGFFRDELYDDISCDGGCTVTSGDPIAVSLGATTTAIDFALVPRGRISGVVTEVGTGAPIPDVSVGVYSVTTGEWVAGATTMSDGSYLTSVLPQGTYHVLTYNFSQYRDEVFDDLPCTDGCDATLGTPVEVSNDATTSGIDFALDPDGRIAGTVTAADGGAALQGVLVRFFDTNGFSTANTVTAADGSYLSPRLPSGTYFAKARGSSLGYLDEVFDDLPCGSCDVTTGTPLMVTLATTTSGVDFSLDRLGGIAGTVTAADTGEALFAEVLALDSAGRRQGSGYTSAGQFEIDNLPPGSYYLKAVYGDSPDEYEDEVYGGLPCEPSCDLSLATPLTVQVGTTVTGADIALERCALDSYADLLGLEILSTFTAEACERVSARAVTIDAGTTVVFRSGREIVLGDGFRVGTGASFEAVIDPDLVKP